MDKQAIEGQLALPDLKETEGLLVQLDLPVRLVLLVLQGYRATQDRKEGQEPPASRVYRVPKDPRDQRVTEER